MEITIEDEEGNPLLNRREIRFSIVHDGETPSRLAVRDSIAAKIDKASDEVIVHEMDTRFGMNETLGYAKVYDAPEDAKEIEEEYMLDRNKVASDGDTAPGDDEGPDGDGPPEDEADDETAGTEETDDEEPEEDAEAADDEDAGDEEVAAETDDGEEEAEA